MLYCCHRINTIEELKTISPVYGIELDLRDNLSGEIYIAHDPFVPGELFEDFLKFYKNSLESKDEEIKEIKRNHKTKVSEKYFCFFFV